MSWTGLDQAYLDIFGTHPDIDGHDACDVADVLAPVTDLHPRR